MLILKDEHAIDVLKSGNTGHLWHDFHAIGVHATDVGHPDDYDGDGHGDDTEAETNEKEEASPPRARNSRSVDREIETKIENGIDFRDQCAGGVCSKSIDGEHDEEDHHHHHHRHHHNHENFF